MKSIFALIGLMMTLASCSHYRTIQMGSGEFTAREVVRCTDFFLGFPGERSRTRIDVALYDLGLKPSDVYSIQERSWPYTFPIYWNRCLAITLNESGLAKVPKAEMIYHSFANDFVPKTQKQKDVKPL